MVSSVYRIFCYTPGNFLGQFFHELPIQSLRLEIIENSEDPQDLSDLRLEIFFPEELYQQLFEKALEDNGVKYQKIF